MDIYFHIFIDIDHSRVAYNGGGCVRSCVYFRLQEDQALHAAALGPACDLVIF